MRSLSFTPHFNSKRSTDETHCSEYYSFHDVSFFLLFVCVKCADGSINFKKFPEGGIDPRMGGSDPLQHGLLPDMGTSMHKNIACFRGSVLLNFHCVNIYSTVTKTSHFSLRPQQCLW